MKTATSFLLPGINVDDYDPEKHKIVSMASCTTNALAPVVKVMLENWGIKLRAVLDGPCLHQHPVADRPADEGSAQLVGRRREHLIPSSSGAARSLSFIWPGLKITGKAYRVPVRTGSIVELNVMTERPVTVDAVNDAFRKAASEAPLKGIDGGAGRRVGLVAYRRRSALIDHRPAADQVQGELLSVAAWYDNEMGYSTSLAETAARIA